MDQKEHNRRGFGPFSLSYGEARKIQEKQYLFYTRHADDYGKMFLREWLERETGSFQGNRDVPMSIFSINDMVPRGGWFEHAPRLALCRPLGFPRQITPGI